MWIKMKSFINNKYPFLLSFFGPIVIMLAYFIARHMYPFGSSTILTVDLGQQYVDFFAFFRETLLHHPGSFFYSFSKAIGGEMIGEWAYYLLSPFNLLFIFFPGKSIAAGVLVVTLLKYGFCGLSFAYLLSKRKLQKGWMIPTFSISYALMAWNVVNQLNLLWMDAAILLPLIIASFYDLMEKRKMKTYPLLLALMLIDNYYMAYMVCIFLVLFFIWYQITYTTKFKEFLSRTWLFASRSILAGGIAAVILIPTAITLTSSKGQYTESSIQAKLEYNPLKMLSKLTIGSFNFDQMPSGFPNIFIGSLALFAFILYFFNRQNTIKSRISAFLISIFFTVSMCFEPLDLFWHGMQFPVWYPYRFTFIVSFWMLFLGSQGITNFIVNVKPWKIFLLFFIEVGIISYVWINVKKFNYATTETLIFSATFAFLVLLLLSINSTNDRSIIKFLLLFLVAVSEMSANMIFSLNNISYLSKREFADPTTALTADSSWLHRHDSSFYRTAQIYSRTKNDGITHNLNAGAYFSSALEKNIPDFYGMIGQPDGDNYVTYSNGSLITDGLLDMKYAIAPKNNNEITEGSSHGYPLIQTSERSDLSSYQLLKNNPRTSIYQNPYATSIGYSAGSTISKMQRLFDNPVIYQSNWLNAASSSMPGTTYFTAMNFNKVIFTNTAEKTTLTNSDFKKIDKSKDASITFEFIPTTNNSYYLTLGTSLDNDNVEFLINDRVLHNYSTFRHTTLVNVANNDKGKKISITAKFKKDNLWLNNFVLYQLDNNLVKQKLTQIKKYSWKIQDYSSTSLSGTINIAKSNQWFATTIPYNDGWKAYIDGKEVPTYKIQQTFIGFPISKGKHQVKLTFTPPYLYQGLVVSVISLMLLFISGMVKRKVHK